MLRSHVCPDVLSFATLLGAPAFLWVSCGVSGVVRHLELSADWDLAEGGCGWGGLILLHHLADLCRLLLMRRGGQGSVPGVAACSTVQTLGLRRSMQRWVVSTSGWQGTLTSGCVPAFRGEKLPRT